MENGESDQVVTDEAGGFTSECITPANLQGKLQFAECVSGTCDLEKSFLRGRRQVMRDRRQIARPKAVENYFWLLGIIKAAHVRICGPLLNMERDHDISPPVPDQSATRPVSRCHFQPR
jgi:hypothetical protein